MKALTTLVSASAIALAIAATAAPSQAAILFASFDTGTSNASNIAWTQGGGGSGGTLDTIGDGAAVKLTFFDPVNLPDFDGIKAVLTLHGTSTDVADFDGSTYTQTGVGAGGVGGDGVFNFAYAGPNNAVVDGFTLTTGESLLSGTFNDAWIQGDGGVGGFAVTIGNAGSATFASNIYDLSKLQPGTEEFTLHLGNVDPNFGSSNPNTGCAKTGLTITCSTPGTTSLNSFTAHAGGDFQYGAVPEPATWGLMLVGFGGMGALLRSRRRMAAVAA